MRMSLFICRIIRPREPSMMPGLAAGAAPRSDQSPLFRGLLLRRRCRACCRRGLRALLRRLRNRHDLYLLVDRSRRMRGVQQLFLAQPHRLQALRRDLEGVDQYVADRVRPSLAEKRVVFALSVGLDVADDQETVW